MTEDDELVGRTLLGRYRVVMPLGHGGMGRVYLARTEGAAGFAKPAVVKRVLPELVTSRTTVDLFVREAKILANLHHPGIVNVVDFGEDDGAYVMVLEYVHGYDLATWSAYARQTGRIIPCDMILFLLIRVLETLHYAHQYQRPDGKPLGIVHRDVSPGNVLLSADGQIKLGDFGIARISDEASDVQTQFGTFRGKIAYAAPELLEGDEATPAADVYSAGVVLLELLLGTNPYSAATVTESMHRVLTMSPPILEGMRADLPAGLDEVLARALAKPREHRYPATGVFADELRRLLPRAEDQTAHALAERIRADFAGDMAATLQLIPLVDRDNAWRSAEPERASLTLGRVSARPAMPSRSSVLDAAPADQTTLIEETVVPPVLTKAARKAGPPNIPRLTLAVGVVLVIAAAVTGWALWRSRDQVGPEYVVIERQPNDPGHAPPSGSTAFSQPGPSSESGAAPAASAPQASSVQVADLSRAVQRRQGKIQACFEQHVAKIGGNPQVTLRFELDKNGKVVETRLEPAGLAESPLGACLSGVAASTEFPAPGRPVSFRVPITARMAASH